VHFHGSEHRVAENVPALTSAKSAPYVEQVITGPLSKDYTEGLSVLDGEPPAAAGVQDGLSGDGVRGEVALHGFPAAGAAGWSPVVIAVPVACR